MLRGIPAAGVPTMVMPSRRRFYDEVDMRAVFDAIAMARRLGAHRRWYSARSRRNAVSTPCVWNRCSIAAAGLPLTFHRAFDEAADQQAHAVLGRYRDAGVAASPPAAVPPPAKEPNGCANWSMLAASRCWPAAAWMRRASARCMRACRPASTTQAAACAGSTATMRRSIRMRSRAVRVPAYPPAGLSG